MRGRMRGAGQYDATSSASSSAAADAALAAKDRLVQFDRISAARTTVIDDQSDWFEIDGNAWLDERERAALKKQAAEMEAAEEERRRRRGMHVSIDLLGRRIGAVAVVGRRTRIAWRAARRRRRGRRTAGTPCRRSTTTAAAAAAG